MKKITPNASKIYQSQIFVACEFAIRIQVVEQLSFFGPDYRIDEQGRFLCLMFDLFDQLFESIGCDSNVTTCP